MNEEPPKYNDEMLMIGADTNIWSLTREDKRLNRCWWIASNGTVYFAGADGHLYRVRPNGPMQRLIEQ